ncbi:MAG: phenylacetate--CoA ligase family protein, partial [Gemmatimonadales bacterium]|nr:phenylacetate--CoA ligase family protein [Gemmatimonadales bacterium]
MSPKHVTTTSSWRTRLSSAASLPGIARAVLRHAHGSRAQLEAYQDRAVARLVAHAYDRVPFYREVYQAAGVRPEQVRSVADLARLPLVTKDELRARAVGELLARGLDPGRLLSISTTGSTGRPIRIYNTWLEYRILHLFRLRAHRQFGRRVGDRIAEIDQPIPPHPNDKKIIGRTLRALGLEARLQLSVYEPDDVLLDRLEAFAPDMVTAYPNVLIRLGRALRERPRRRLRPRFLLTNSEVLSPSARAELRTSWDAEVFQFYDCHECNLIAWDCAAGHGLHCNEDVAVVEVLRNGVPAATGERGEIAITSLHSYAMPFVRFCLGDVATRGPSPCPCGQPFATLQAVEGRMVDFFRLPGGRWLHPYRLIENVDADGVEWIQQYRLVQEREDRIVFNVVPTPRATAERLEAFRRYAAAAVGPEVEVVVRFVETLEIGPGGKLRPAYSLINSDYGSVDWARVDGGGSASG